ncbi:hypothetical protein [Catenulispora rubra]
MTVFYFPAYTPTLNRVEGVWPTLKRSLAARQCRSTARADSSRLAS